MSGRKRGVYRTDRAENRHWYLVTFRSISWNYVTALENRNYVNADIRTGYGTGTHAYTHIHTCIHMHTHIYTQIHTYIHTHTYKHINSPYKCVSNWNVLFSENTFFIAQQCEFVFYFFLYFPLLPETSI